MAGYCPLKSVTAVTARRTTPANTVTAVTTDTLSFVTPFTAEELLSSIIDDGILDEDGVHKLMSKKKLDYVQKNHSLSIWKGADGRWRTYLPDAEKPNGRKLVSRGSHDELISMLFDFYTEAEKQRKRLQITLEELFDEWQQHKSIYVTDSTIRNLCMRAMLSQKSLYAHLQRLT